MNVKDTTGTCQLCGVELKTTNMTKHLAECVEAYRHEVGRDEERGDNGYHLGVHSTRAPMFWLHLLVRSDARLSHLDSYLRDVWMEDRDKQSRFIIGNGIFASEPSLGGGPMQTENDMSAELHEVLDADVPFQYTYDLEQTTELEARVVARRNVLPDQEETPVRLLARNELPAIPCQCGDEAEYLCPNCAEGPEGWLCEVCAGDHDCGTDAEIVEIANSPRAIAHALT
jgi:hypothetical protein